MNLAERYYEIDSTYTHEVYSHKFPVYATHHVKSNTSKLTSGEVSHPYNLTI